MIRPTPRTLVLAAVIAAASLPARGAFAQAEARPAAVFEDGEAQVVEAFARARDWIRHDLFVETEFDSDGDGANDRMHVCVTRPQQTETEGLKVPVIYETSPYFSGVADADMKRHFWNPAHELGEAPPAREFPPAIHHMPRRSQLSRSLVRTWVPRGFAVVHSSSPGTGRSQGCPTIGGENEALAPKAVIDWLNGRAKGYTEPVGGEEVTADWSTGKVGMTGTSYNGTLPIAAATTGVEGLEAIIPIAPNTSYYHYYRSHGLVRHPGGYMGEDIDVLYDFVNSGDPERRDWCNEHVRDELLMVEQDRLTGDLNEFWAGRDYANQLTNARAALLMAHGFNDWNVMPEHSVRIYEAWKRMGLPCQVYFHQQGHGGEPPMSLMNRWFTRYLHGVDNGVEDDPRSFVVREDDRPNRPTPYADYPHPKSEHVRLFPHGSAGASGLLATEPDPDSAPETLVDDVSIAGRELANANDSKHRLLFVTPELTRPVHVSGTPRVEIRIASSKPAANLSVWLVSLPWTGPGIKGNVITRGWADPQNHETLKRSEPLEPGKFYDLGFTLQPDDEIVFEGQRIGLMVFSSDREFTLWPEPGTELTVDLAGTSLELPVVGGASAFEAATTAK